MACTKPKCTTPLPATHFVCRCGAPFCSEACFIAAWHAEHRKICPSSEEIEMAVAESAKGIKGAMKKGSKLLVGVALKKVTPKKDGVDVATSSMEKGPTNDADGNPTVSSSFDLDSLRAECNELRKQVTLASADAEALHELQFLRAECETLREQLGRAEAATADAAKAGEEIGRKEQQLLRECERLTEQVQTLSAAGTAGGRDVQQLQAEVDQLRMKSADLWRDCAWERGRANDLEDELTTARKAARDAEDEARKRTAKLDELQQRCEDLEAAGNSSGLADMQQQMVSLEANATELRERIASMVMSEDESQRNSQRQHRDLEDQCAELKANLASFAVAEAELSRNLANECSVSKGLKDENSGLESRLAEAQSCEDNAELVQHLQLELQAFRERARGELADAESAAGEATARNEAISLELAELFEAAGRSDASARELGQQAEGSQLELHRLRDEHASVLDCNARLHTELVDGERVREEFLFECERSRSLEASAQELRSNADTWRDLHEAASSEHRDILATAQAHASSLQRDLDVFKTEVGECRTREKQLQADIDQAHATNVDTVPGAALRDSEDRARQHESEVSALFARLADAQQLHTTASGEAQFNRQLEATLAAELEQLRGDLVEAQEAAVAAQQCQTASNAEVTGLREQKEKSDREGAKWRRFLLEEQERNNDLQLQVAETGRQRHEARRTEAARQRECERLHKQVLAVEMAAEESRNGAALIKRESKTSTLFNEASLLRRQLTQAQDADASKQRELERLQKRLVQLEATISPEGRAVEPQTSPEKERLLHQLSLAEASEKRMRHTEHERERRILELEQESERRILELERQLQGSLSAATVPTSESCHAPHAPSIVLESAVDGNMAPLPEQQHIAADGEVRCLLPNSSDELAPNIPSDNGETSSASAPTVHVEEASVLQADGKAQQDVETGFRWWWKKS